MAHVQRRGDKWQARFRGPDGKERSQRFERKVDAENWLSTQSADVVRGTWTDPRAGEVSFRAYAKSWLQTKADVSDRTMMNIETRLNRHALPYFGDRALNTVRPSDVRGFVARLKAAGLAPSTVKAAYLTVSQIFRQAVTDKLIPESPCAAVSLPSQRHQKRMHFLEAAQVNALAEAIDERYRALVYTAAYSGLRAGELGALKVHHLHLLGGPNGPSITVDAAASEVRGKLIVGPTKTGRRREVAIPRFLAQMLGEHIGQYPSREGFVFTAAEGGQLRHRNFYQRHFGPAVARAGLPEGLRFHDLRHTCAALLIANGRHMEEVKDHLGHSSIRVTSDSYGHLFASARLAISDALEATFQGSAAAAAADNPRTAASVVPISDANRGAI